MFARTIWSGFKNILAWLHEYSETIRAIVTVIAIFVGGLWTYNEFVRERVDQPRLNISLAIKEVKIPDDQIWLEIRTHLENLGRTKIDIVEGFTRIQQILPLTDRMNEKINGDDKEQIRELNERRFVPWPTLCKRRFVTEFSLEPGEKFTLTQEFFVPRSANVIRLYTFLTSPISEQGIPRGWADSTVYEIASSKAEQSNENVDDSRGIRRICVAHR